jgi:N-carbamoyl-L-amino-acid hydrolase
VNRKNITLNADRLLSRLEQLGATGRSQSGVLTRLAASDEDRAGRDLLVSWLEEAGLEVKIDGIGNIFGLWKPPQGHDLSPLMIGSHIDTPINAGILDGCYGVIAGLEVIQSLQEAGHTASRPLMVAAFSNEEGVRYAPDMMGSLVYAGGLPLDEALATVGTDGTVLGDELRRIGYLGENQPGFVTPYAYLELHIEQGPILERKGIDIGVVENLQGISWQRVTINGQANHAGTTPMSMRKDAGVAAAKVITYLHETACRSETSVATVGTLSFRPNAINVVPSQTTLTVDLRDPSEQELRKLEQDLKHFLSELAADSGLKIECERLARFEPAEFAPEIVAMIEKIAQNDGLTTLRMTSGAGHDAQMMARICPSAMIFVQSEDGISHNPREHTPTPDLLNGANILLKVILELSRDKNSTQGVGQELR